MKDRLSGDSLFRLPQILTTHLVLCCGCMLLCLHVPNMTMPAAAVLRYEELCQNFLLQQVEEVLRFPLELTTYQVGCRACNPASACMVQQPAGVLHLP